MRGILVHYVNVKFKFFCFAFLLLCFYSVGFSSSSKSPSSSSIPIKLYWTNKHSRWVGLLHFFVQIGLQKCVGVFNLINYYGYNCLPGLFTSLSLILLSHLVMYCLVMCFLRDQLPFWYPDCCWVSYTMCLMCNS